MASVSSATNLQGLQQFKLQQARRSAESAESRARALEQQAQQAQQTAERAQQDADYLTVQAGQAQAGAGRARQSLAALQSDVTPAKTASLSEQVGDSLPVQPTNRASAPSSLPAVGSSEWARRVQPQAAAVINGQGQVTGTLLNVTA